MRHARPDLGEALTALGGEGRVDPPLPHDVRGQVAERVAVPHAVVDLDEPVVDLHLHAARDTDGLGRLAGAAQRAAGDRDGWRPHREREGQRGGLRAAPLVERRVEAPEEQALGVGVRLAVAGQHERAHDTVLIGPASLGDRLQPAAAPELAAWPGQVEVELADDPPAREQPGQLLERRPPTTRAGGPRRPTR